jgi:hypothetical protein
MYRVLEDGAVLQKPENLKPFDYSEDQMKNNAFLVMLTTFDGALSRMERSGLSHQNAKTKLISMMHHGWEIDAAARHLIELHEAENRAQEPKRR